MRIHVGDCVRARARFLIVVQRVLGVIYYSEGNKKFKVIDKGHYNAGIYDEISFKALSLMVVELLRAIYSSAKNVTPRPPNLSSFWPLINS